MRPNQPLSEKSDVDASLNNDQALSPGRLPCQETADASESIPRQTSPNQVKLTEGQRKVLGCIACITNRGERPVANAARIVSQCTGKNNGLVRQNIGYLTDVGLIDAQDRDPTTTRRRESRQQHQLTDTGAEALPFTWQKCENAESYTNPLLSLTSRQQRFMRCISCLASQGKDILNTTIAECNGEVPNNILSAMRKITQDGFLTAKRIDAEPGAKKGSKRLVYTPTGHLLPHLPEAPSPETCTFNTSQTERTADLLTPVQRRLLSCIGCISSRTTLEFGAAKETVEACTGQSITTTFSASEKLATLGLITVHSQALQGRTYYQLHKEGAEVAELLPPTEDCKQPQNIEPVDKNQAIQRCLECIWGRQISNDHDPAATIGMISDCTGFSTINVRKRLTRFATQGKLKQLTIEHDVLRNLRRPTIAFAPAHGPVSLHFTETCNLGLYPDIPEEYLKPVFLKKLPRLEKSSQQDKDVVRAFITAKHTLLTKEQEWALGETIQHSSSAAERDVAVTAFIEHNIKLAVWYVVNKSDFEGMFLSFEDRVQEALIGIEDAARHFNPKFEVRFSSYALFWVKQRVQRAAAAQAGIPVNTFTNIPISYYRAQDFAAAHGRPPTILELAVNGGSTPKKVLRMLEARDQLILQGLSLDHIITDQNRNRRFGENTMHDIVGASEDNFDEVESSDLVQKLLPYLAPHEKAILGNILGYHKITTYDIAEATGVSQMTVTVAKHRVKALLRHPFFGIGAAHSKSKEWQFDASCAVNSVDTVVKRNRADAEVPANVKQLCSYCPVRKQCFEETLSGTNPVPVVICAGFNVTELKKYHKRSRSTRVTTKSPETSITQS